MSDVSNVSSSVAVQSTPMGDASTPKGDLVIKSEPVESVAVSVMAVKSGTVIGLKSAMASSALSMAEGASAVSGIMVGIGAPITGYKLFHLIKNWRNKSRIERMMMSLDITANATITAAGSIMIAAKALGAKVAVVAGSLLGPIGIGMMAALSFVRGGMAIKEAIQAPQGQKLSPTMKAVKYALFGVGLTLGAAAIVGIAATPIVGWVAAGVVGAGLLVHIGAKVLESRNESKAMG